MPLTTQELESKLWQAADILRGQIDSADYKNYIFSILFLKRLSDRFDEEVENAVASGVAREVALTDWDEHEFFVPESARWPALTGASMNRGEALNIASHAIEEANPRLDGVLATTNWNDETKLGSPGEPRGDHPEAAEPLRRPRPARREPARGLGRRRQCPGRRLRVPDQPVRRRRREEGRRVLHSPRGGRSHRPSTPSDRGDAHLRPDGRLRRDAHPRGPVRAGAQRESQQPRAPRPGAQPGNAGHRQAQPAAPRPAVSPAGARRRHRGTGTGGPVGTPARLRPGDRQSALQPQELGARLRAQRSAPPLRPIRAPSLPRRRATSLSCCTCWG